MTKKKTATNVEKPQLVLIRGIMSESYHWYDFIPLLQESGLFSVVHCPDIIGNGQYYHKKTPMSLKNNIEELRKQIPKKSKIVLLGFSLGGMLAMEWSHLYPEEVEALILINTSFNNAPFYHRLTPYSLKKIVQAAFQKELYHREHKIVSLTTMALQEERKIKIVNDWTERSKLHPVPPENFFRQMMIAIQAQQRDYCPCPVLILSSKHDKVVHPKCSKLIAKKWQIPLWEHPTAGHDITLEDPQWVLARMKKFISDNFQNKIEISKKDLQNSVTIDQDKSPARSPVDEHKVR